MVPGSRRFLMRRNKPRQRTQSWLVWFCAALVVTLSVPAPLLAQLAGGGERPHPLGRAFDSDLSTRVVIRDLEIRDEHPVFGPEWIVLTTVGTEHQESGKTVFHPLVSVAIDRTFDAEGPGEWLAIWNLGRKSPGIMSRIGATVPGFAPWKHSTPRQLRKLNKRLENFDRRWEKGKVSVPIPYLKVTERNRRSTIGLFLSGLKKGFGPIIDLFPVTSELSFGVELVFRNYLLRHKDLQERDFAQAYLGMLWYTDVSTADFSQEELSAPAIEDIKYRLLKERSIFGRWVDSSAKPDFVHGFESQMRDHLWGTSCFLASAANRHYLVYEELQRFTATGVPLALGGILYYDPALAPEPEQVRWSINNPFDLSHNPFKNGEVQEAAASGQRVPLAVYVYQSNLALKPIIVADFINPDNPRLREAATYWRRLGNEALGTVGIGLIYNLLNRVFSFTANRKELTWCSDKKFSYGIEEMRLSLANHLYFDQEAADELVDQVDRVVVNPLAQSSRAKALRARIQYRALTADGGAAVLKAVRKIRDSRVRDLPREKKSQTLAQADYERYRASLDAQRQLEVLRVFSRDEFLPSIPSEDVKTALQELASDRHAFDVALKEELLEFQLEIQNRPKAGPMKQFQQQVTTQIEHTLVALYQASGHTAADYETDLLALGELRTEEEGKARLEWEKDHSGKVAKKIKDSLKVLEGFIESDGDLEVYSPWYIAESLEVMQQIPSAVAVNPLAATKYAKFEERITGAVSAVEALLAPERSPALSIEWMEEQRSYCLLTAQETRATLDEFRTMRRVSRVGAAPRATGANNQ